jgi:hypothetical protein
LRAHDVHQGLHEVDRTSALLAGELEVTQLVGMAAAVAAWVKGHDVIADAQALKLVAAEQLDVLPFAFERIVEMLSDLDFVRNVQTTGHRITSFYETVPEDYERMYGQLGQAWRAQEPTEVETSLLGVVEELSNGPRPVDTLDVDADALEDVLHIGQEAEAIQIVTVDARRVAYSPFFAYEKPQAIGTALSEIGLERVAAAFAGVKAFQGVPLSTSADGAVLTGLVAAGLMAGPSLERPDESRELFAVAPYGLGADVLSIRRPLLEKALAILASVRMGQHFGGVTRLQSPAALLQALMQSDRIVAWHSSTTRQYAVLQRLGIVRFVSSGGRSGIQLIDTDDNVLAVRLALDLLGAGEATSTKGASTSLEQALLAPGHYRTQIQGIRHAKRRPLFDGTELAAMVEATMGWRPE